MQIRKGFLADGRLKGRKDANLREGPKAEEKSEGIFGRREAGGAERSSLREGPKAEEKSEGILADGRLKGRKDN
ncbi:hypothetical protein J25TS5_38590 [Paenibacillus faecis]|nr:hypothetical protein J25TS5_38590 [Paenibacillus faecis]